MNKWCLLCGAEYMPRVIECSDCLVPLSDRRPLSVEELVGADEDHVAYDFDELGAMQRLSIDERFWANGVPHAWDGFSLVVREADEVVVELEVAGA